MKKCRWLCLPKIRRCWSNTPGDWWRRLNWCRHASQDQVAAQAAYTAAYKGYLLRGVHLLLIDIHRRPLAFSFADQIATSLGMHSATLPAPCAVGYRVGDPAPTGGSFLAIWRRSMTVGEPLPSMRLPLSVSESVPVDLERTYQRATAAAYLP